MSGWLQVFILFFHIYLLLFFFNLCSSWTDLLGSLFADENYGRTRVDCEE